MPFNPDEFLAQKQAAAPASGTADGFDPDAFLASKGAAPEIAAPQGQLSPAESYKQSNPPTPLSAAVLGFEQGASYNAAKKVAGMADAESAAAFDVNREQYPITSALGQLTGAVLAPSPIGKLKAIKEAGTLAKMAFNASDFASRLGLSSFLGSNEESMGGKLKDVQEAFKDPVTLGLGAISTLAPALPSIIRKGSNILVKDGKKSVALGKGMKDALTSEAGQEAVSRAVGKFESDTISAAQKGLSSLGQSMDEVAAQNTDTVVNARSGFSKMFDFIKSQKPEELLDKDRVALAKLGNFVTAADEAGSSSDSASFQQLYEVKKNLGRLLFDPSSGAARTFNNADSSIKRAGIKLYSDISDALAKSDKTTTFKDLSKAFTGVYKTMDAADDIGNSLAKMADKLNVSGVNKRDALVEAYKSIPPQYLATLPDLGNQVINKMDDTITAYNIASKISGKAPQQSSIIAQMLSKIPVTSEGSRLNFLNQMGQMSAGRAPTGALGAGMKAVGSASSPAALSNISSQYNASSPGALRELK